MQSRYLSRRIRTCRYGRKNRDIFASFRVVLCVSVGYGMVKLLVGRNLFAISGHAGVDIPENEGTRVLLLLARGMPPAAKHNHASRQNDALISPQGAFVHDAIFVLPVFHHDHAMPTRDSVLWRQGIEVARCFEGFVGIFTIALETEGYWFTLRQDMRAGGSSLGSCSGCAVLYLGTRLKDLFKEGGPRFRILLGKVEAEVLC
jgi:hypothetical protein